MIGSQMSNDSLDNAVTMPGKNVPTDASIGDAPTLRLAEGSGGRGAFAPGDAIAGRYVVERTLGEGGMGIVYQCLDKVGGVKVAVKCLPPEVSCNADEMEEIRANYRLVADLHHPNIAGARTLEVDSSTGDYYLVMDLARGTSLKRWIKRNPQATTEAKLAILRQIAAALDYAHARKVIHRDVKPENVMVDDEGGVKVLDFGLAAQIRSSQSRTSAAVMSKGGTPGYKSPEQWRGKPQRAAADVYSFGVMAYWMFAGALPFDGDDPVVLGHAVLTEPVEPVKGLPESMNAALAKALAKQPEDRFASCGAVVDALEGKGLSRVEHVVRVEGGNGRARSSSGPQSGGPRPVAAVKGLLAAAALGLAAFGGWWWANDREGTKGTQGTKATIGTNATNVVQVPSVPSVATPRPTHEPVARMQTPASRNGESRPLTLPGGVEMEMIYVAPGSFMMGSPESEEGRFDNESQHRVTLTKGYWIGKYPVTQSQWKALVSANGVSFEEGEPTPYFSREGGGSDCVSGMDTSDFPMESVSWNDCDALVKALNRNATDGRTYSLPTEAQWEFAARGGTKSRGYIYSGGNDMDALGWYYENSGLRRLSDGDWKIETLSSNKCRTHSVREKDVGNELGIVGMSGNVLEWCLDWYDKDYYAKSPTEDPCNTASGGFRVLRGGSWFHDARNCRSAFRSGYYPGYRINIFGFRLCCSAGPRGGAEQ